MRLLRIGDVQQKVGLARVTIRQKVREGLFPRPVQLFPNDEAQSPRAHTACWVEAEIDGWIAKQVEARDGQHKQQSEPPVAPSHAPDAGDVARLFALWRVEIGLERSLGIGEIIKAANREMRGILLRYSGPGRSIAARSLSTWLRSVHRRRFTVGGLTLDITPSGRKGPRYRLREVEVAQLRRVQPDEVAAVARS